MRISRWTLPLALGLLFATVAPVQAARPPRPASAVQLESFEYAWQRIAEVHPDASLGGLDWQAIHDELLPQALQARTNGELRVVLQDLVHRLPGQHHNVIAGNGTAVEDVGPNPHSPPRQGRKPPPNGASIEVSSGPGESLHERTDLPEEPVESVGSTLGNLVGLGAPPGLPGFLTRVVGGQQRVTWLEPEGPAVRAGLRLGDTLVRLDGQPCPGCELAGPITQVARVQYSRLGEPGGELAIPRSTLGLFQAPPVGTSPPWPGFAGHWSIVANGGQRVRYVRVSVFAVPTVPIFAAAVEAARNGEEQGLILDLRGNPGGFVQAGQGFAGYLLDSPQSLGRMISREMNLQLKVNPRPEAQRFSGKVAVLVDRGSASTSELLAGALQELGRAKLFGEPSAGALESSLMERLPNGDTLQLVLASVEMPSGRIVEGSGLKPDLLAPLDSSALDQGRDPAIEAALVWIGSPSPE